MRTKSMPMTVVGSRITQRQVLPKRFKKIGVPTVKSMVVLRDDGWRAAVVSVWSWGGEELGRERKETAKTYPTSAEAMVAAEKMRSRMERAEPVDESTRRTVATIRRSVGRRRARSSMSRIFVSNGRPVLP
jgi:hypothetical protein